MPTIERHLPVRAVTRGPKHHWFGYYDKFPWDATGRYLLGLESDFMDRPPRPGDKATIGLIDLQKGCSWTPIAATEAWNWQQGSMLHWLPTAPDRLILHNSLEDGRYVAIVRDAFSGTVVRKLPRPVYALSRDGRQAVSVSFSRLHDCRPGYGYNGIPDENASDPHPANDGIWWMDVETGEHRMILSVAQLAAMRPEASMEGAKHRFNHLQFCTDDSRFLFLHRWKTDPKAVGKTRLYTANPDGSDLYCVSDHDMVSHFDWRDANRILAWATWHGIGNRFFLFSDRSAELKIVGDAVLTVDGHCSYSPNREWILTDTYPDRERKRTLILYDAENGRRFDIGRFYAPPEIDGETRCDLHPRWSRDGRQICFDSVHEGSRQMYLMDVGEIVG